MRMTETAATRVARRHLQELSYWAATTPGEKSLAYHGAVAQAKALIETQADTPPASLETLAKALRDLVTWTQIGLAPPSRTLGCVADRAERFLTSSSGRPRPGQANRNRDRANLQRERRPVATVEIEGRMIAGRGVAEIAALGILADTLKMKVLTIEAALCQVRAMQSEAEGLAQAADATDEPLLTACDPFAACVFNDNGDVTVTTSNLRDHHWVALHLAVAQDGGTPRCGGAPCRSRPVSGGRTGTRWSMI